MSASNVVYKYSRSLRIMATHTSSMHKLMNATATSRMYQQSGNKYTCALLSNKNTISYYCLCTLIQNDIMYVSVCIYTSCPNLLRMRSVPNENKMRHNLPFRDEITIEIQNRSPLAWSRRNGFFRSRSRSRLRNSYSVCLQTLPMLFFIHSHFFEDCKLGLFYAYVDRYFDVSLVAFYQYKPRPRKNTKPNNKNNKKGII